MTSRRLRIGSLLAIAALLFSQLALSAHGCDRVTRHSPACEEMAPAQDDESTAHHPSTTTPSTLCMKHCEDGKADVAKPVAPIALALATISIPLPMLVPIATSQRSVTPPTPYPPPPSFAARSAALRI
jgi:hypothetical protein